jgi:hypothetical protein
VATNVESETSPGHQGPKAQAAGWLRLAILTAGSAFIGGVAAAWWYRKTLAKLHETAEKPKNPHFGMPIDQPTDDSHDEV